MVISRIISLAEPPCPDRVSCHVLVLHQAVMFLISQVGTEEGAEFLGQIRRGQCCQGRIVSCCRWVVRFFFSLCFPGRFLLLFIRNCAHIQKIRTSRGEGRGVKTERAESRIYFALSEPVLISCLRLYQKARDSILQRDFCFCHSKRACSRAPTFMRWRGFLFLRQINDM